MLNRWQQIGGRTGWHRNQDLSKFCKVAVVVRVSTTISDVARSGLAQDVLKVRVLASPLANPVKVQRQSPRKCNAGRSQ